MNKAKGRSLSDFGDLLPAEQKLLDACLVGTPTFVDSQRPSERSIENTIRAGVVAFLAMGGDEGAPVHHRGIDLAGAWIVDVLDLQRAEVCGNLHFRNCRFDTQPIMHGCFLNGNFSICNCVVPGISMDGAKVQGFVRFDENEFVGPVRLVNSEIFGMLSFRGSELDCEDTLSLTFDRAAINGSVFLDEISTKGLLKFSGARIQGNVSLRKAKLICRSRFSLDFDRAEIVGDVFLDRGFVAEGGARFHSAQISGNLSCVGGEFLGKGNEAIFADNVSVGGTSFFRETRTFGVARLLGSKIRGDADFLGANLKGGDGEALFLDGSKIEGSLVLSGEFFADGLLRFRGIQLGADLVCTGARLDGKNAVALDFSGANIVGSVLLNRGFEAKGEVSLLGTKIGRIFDCSQSSFTRQLSSEHTLSAEGASVAGVWFLLEMREPLNTISLAGFSVGSICDDDSSWGSDLTLDNFRYETLAGNSPADADWRLKWLKQQIPAHLKSKEFKPYPWQQLKKVLHEMGHFEDARQVAIAFEDHRRSIGLIGLTPPEWNFFVRLGYRQLSVVLHVTFKKLIGYGYRPLQLMAWMILVWALCAGVFWVASLRGVMGPSSPLVFNDPALRAACSENWYLCGALPEEYTGFSPLAYSLDVLLPLVDLEQAKDWAPLVPTPDPSWWREWLTNWSLKHFTRLVMWAEILFGWMASLLLVAVFSGLTKRREE